MLYLLNGRVDKSKSLFRPAWLYGLINEHIALLCTYVCKNNGWNMEMSDGFIDRERERRDRKGYFIFVESELHRSHAREHGALNKLLWLEMKKQ